MSLFSRIDEFHDQAVQATGYADFGDTSYVEPLRLMLSDYDRHARLTPIGE